LFSAAAYYQYPGTGLGRRGNSQDRHRGHRFHNAIGSSGYADDPRTGAVLRRHGEEKECIEYNNAEFHSAVPDFSAVGIVWVLIGLRP